MKSIPLGLAAGVLVLSACATSTSRESVQDASLGDEGITINVTLQISDNYEDATVVKGIENSGHWDGDVDDWGLTDYTTATIISGHFEGADAGLLISMGDLGDDLSDDAKKSAVSNSRKLKGGAQSAALYGISYGKAGTYAYIGADVPLIGSSEAHAGIVQIDDDGTVTNTPNDSSTTSHIGSGSNPNANFTITPPEG